MSCGFKFCRGGGKCFLEGVSPCSAHDEEVSDINFENGGRSMRKMGLSRTGFVQSVAAQNMASLVEASA